MTTWAILPVKPFHLGKSRLHPFLTSEEIIQLNRKLFTDTYRCLQACQEIDKILVIAKDDAILKLVDEWGGVGLPENTSSSLNLAIAQAFAFIHNSGESGPVLVIPADLPGMKPEDLRGLFALAGSDKSSEHNDGKHSCIGNSLGLENKEHNKIYPFLVIVPDYNQTGTNALLMSEAELITPMFGRRSFQKHIRQALVKSINLTVWLNDAMQSDLDTLQDWQKYNKINFYSTEIII